MLANPTCDATVPRATIAERSLVRMRSASSNVRFGGRSAPLVHCLLRGPLPSFQPSQYRRGVQKGQSRSIYRHSVETSKIPHAGDAHGADQNHTDVMAVLRVVGYARWTPSTGEPDPRRVIRLWARHAGMRVLDVLIDADDERHDLRRALHVLRRGGADALVVPQLSAIADDLLIQEAVMAVVWKYGHRFIAVDRGEIAPQSGDTTRRMVRRALSAYADLDEPPYPLGPDREPLVDVTVDVTDVAMHRIAALHGRGGSLNAIARRLNDEGVPSPRGGKWHPTSVSRMVDQIGQGGHASREPAVAERQR